MVRAGPMTVMQFGEVAVEALPISGIYLFFLHSQSRRIPLAFFIID